MQKLSFLTFCLPLQEARRARSTSKCQQRQFPKTSSTIIWAVKASNPPKSISLIALTGTNKLPLSILYSYTRWVSGCLLCNGLKSSDMPFSNFTHRNKARLSGLNLVAAKPGNGCLNSVSAFKSTNNQTTLVSVFQYYKYNFFPLTVIFTFTSFGYPQ